MPTLKFPRSDGNSLQIPKEDDATGPEATKFTSIPLDDKASLQWRKSIGTWLAEELKVEVPKDRPLEDFPAHYKLFKRSRTGDRARTDYFLYGSKTVANFRSANEFRPHALWLFTDSELSRSNCGCKYCSKSTKSTNGVHSTAKVKSASEVESEEEQADKEASKVKHPKGADPPPKQSSRKTTASTPINTSRHEKPTKKTPAQTSSKPKPTTRSEPESEVERAAALDSAIREMHNLTSKFSSLKEPLSTCINLLRSFQSQKPEVRPSSSTQKSTNRPPVSATKHEDEDEDEESSSEEEEQEEEEEVKQVKQSVKHVEANKKPDQAQAIAEEESSSDGSESGSGSGSGSESESGSGSEESDSAESESEDSSTEPEAPKPSTQSPKKAPITSTQKNPKAPEPIPNKAKQQAKRQLEISQNDPVQPKRRKAAK